KTSAGSWNIINPASNWLYLSETKGTENNATVTLTASQNNSVQRTDTLVIYAGNAKPVNLVISQEPNQAGLYLTVNPTSVNFGSTGGTETITVNTNIPGWSIGISADWLSLTFNSAAGNEGNTSIEITASANSLTNVRSDTAIVYAEGVSNATITIIQESATYPGYNTSPVNPDATGMSSNASELAAKMTIGWNIGNTLEAIGGETAWGNPLITEELIQLVKQNGFNAIRLPCSWYQYMENKETAKIKTEWLDRVKEVVQYCIDNDIYVILNIHWDGGWLENNCTPEKQMQNNAMQKAFWEQIATHLRDFDEHLLFASANEPNVENTTQMSVLNSYHQTFINAVRSTGGKNSYRVLVIQGPSTDIEKTNTLMNTFPADEVENRLMAEIHYYTPYQFTLMTENASWGNMFYYWGKDYHSTTDTEYNATWGEEPTVDALMKLMKTQFIDEGIPVIMGEFGAMRRTSLTGEALALHLESRAYFLKYVTQQAKANGIIPFYWDAGGMGNNGSALFNRKNYTIFDQQALDALMEGVNE
ncbi:MAG: cellulase family glycosylhydrolase, partial [Bacteroidales bacterium]|nr:cellulase family glycosylhydrolase [Bacteroidales bacterium]